jgi:hypothetical protein
MARWIACGAQFVTGDVVRWVEAIWGPKDRKTGKSLPIGTRRMRAQVLERDQVWARLEILPRGCILKAFDGYEGMVGKPLQGEIRRRCGPIGEGAAHRLEWTDESAREIVMSRFLGPEPQPMTPQPAGPRRFRPHPDAGKRGGRAGRYRQPGAGKRGPRPRPRSR